MDLARQAFLLELEDRVVGAWPADETLNLKGWLARRSGGPTHRGNSVSTLRLEPGTDVASLIEQTEAWYRERGQAPQFQLGPCVAPGDLDELLAAHGYRKEGGALFAAAAPARVTASTSAPTQTRLAASPDASWLSVAAGASRFAATEHVFMGFLTRLGSRCAYATALDEHGRAIGAGLGIRSGEHLGIYAMFTLPEQRRQGAAAAVLGAFAEHALGADIRELYLLVGEDNVAARALYAKSGFADVYSYHYRVIGARSTSPSGG